MKLNLRFSSRHRKIPCRNLKVSPEVQVNRLKVVFKFIKMTTYGMKELEERHVPTTVLKMVWSNKMDLLAIAKEHGKQEFIMMIILIVYFI